IMLRRTLAEVAPDMPPVRWSVFTVEPGDLREFCTADEIAEGLSQQPQLEAALAQAQDEIDQLGDAARDYRRLLGLQKVAPIVDLIADVLDSGGTPNVVLFAWHRDVSDALVQGLRRFNASAIHGGTSDSDKQARQDAFRAGESRVLVCQII